MGLSEKLTKSEKELLAGYIVSVIATIRALQAGETIDDLTFSIIADATARISSLFGITPELVDKVKTDIEFDITFNQK